MPLYCPHYNSGGMGSIYVFPEDTANNGTAVADSTFTLPTTIGEPQGVAISGNDLYIAETNEINVVSADTADGTTATVSRSFTLPPNISTARGMTISGNDLYIVDVVDDVVYIVPADTANGTTLTNNDIVRQFNLPSDLTVPLAMTISGNDLYVADGDGDEVFVMPADTANNGTAVESRRFDLPAFLTSPQGMTISGNDLYVADDASNRVSVLPANTADDGTAVASRRFNLPTGLTSPRGLTFGAGQPTQATITLSTTDTDIRAGDTVTIDIDSSIDITLTDSNITVTGGTRGTLTGSGQDYALSVTAGDAGTLTVSIAEDAVPEGNAAVSEDFTITANYQLHIADGSNDNISVIGYDTADGDTADALRTYTTTDSTDVQSIVYDGTHIHITNWQQSTVRVYAINLSGVSPVVRSYTVTGISQPSGMAFDGTHIHIADRASDNIRVIAPDTADGGTATILRTYEVTGLEDCRGMAFDGENIHAADYTDDNIRVFAPDTPDNGTATVLRTYTVAGVNHSRSIAFDGVNMHVSDVTDDNFRVVAVPTAGGAQTVLRTYTVTDVGNPRGMTGIPVTTTTQANLTITTTHGDIYAGQSVIFQIASDIDITDFTLSDVGLTGATAVGLSTFGERMWRLQTTADDGAGEIVISIAENVVSPGNIAVSETFTRNARITPTIAFSNTDLVPNQQTLATITFPEAVTGMQRGDLTLDVGTLGATLTTVSTTVYRIAITAPSSGSGTMTLTLAEDAVTPPNTAVSASIDYVETLVATTLEIVSGDNQSAQPGNALTNPLVVQVLDQNGDAFSGSTVSFTTTGGTLSETSVVTGADGQASTSLTLPAMVGNYTITASVSGLTDVTFTATATQAPNTPPTFDAASYTFTGVALAVNTGVGTITATDADDDTLTYSLVGAEASSFSIDANSGQITVSTALTYDETYDFQGRVNDGTVNVDVNISVTAVSNTPPAFGQASYTFRNVMVAVNSGVGTVAATDAETLSYSLTGTDASRFDIDSTGQITVATALANSESYSFNVVANDGMATASVPVTVITVSVGIHFQGANRDFPESGYLRIDSELIGYTGIMGSTFTGITRGVLGTTVVDHADESRITYLNFVLQDQDLTGRVVIRADTANIFNVVRNTEGTVEVRDADSIAKFGEKVYTLDLGRLTNHDLQWQENVLQKYLDTLKDLQYLISFDVLPTLGYLRIGDIVGFRYAGLLYTMRIVSLTKSLETINIKGRTVS